MELFTSAKNGYQGLVSTLSRIGALNIEQLEKVADRQLDSAQYYTGIGISQFKGAVSSSGMKGFKGYSADTVAAGNKVAKRVLEDGKEMAGFAAAYKDGFVDIVKSGFGK